MLDDNATSRNARRGGDHGADSLDGEPDFAENALSVPESDPERIAFNLWNEGRVDEAIQFLEREILARTERYGPAQGENADLPALARIEQRKVEPVSDWRERHRSALSPADFNAFGTVRQIDLVAKSVDAILPHPPRRSLRPAWIMGLGLVVIGLSAGAVIWSDRAVAPGDTALPAVQPTAEIEPAIIVPPAGAKPETEIATAETGTVLPPKEAAPVATPAETNADMAPEMADVPPPDDELIPEDLPSEPMTTGPETTASIDPAPADAEPSSIVEARVPRQRPEPPAAAPRSSPADDPAPRVVHAPASPPGFAPGSAPPYDPMNPRPTLTPAEYQVLLERRAWAENYSARRRAVAQRRVLEEEPPGFLGARGPLIRILRD